jgi:hypothetical protein
VEKILIMIIAGGVAFCGCNVDRSEDGGGVALLCECRIGEYRDIQLSEVCLSQQQPNSIDRQRLLSSHKNSNQAVHHCDCIQHKCDAHPLTDFNKAQTI